MKYKNISWLALSLLLIIPTVVSAQSFQPLVGIPGISDPNASFEDYINTLYLISISVAALIAVIKIIIAGLKYMLSDSVGSKSGAKSDIQGALIGLVVIAAAVLILETINPQLTQSNLFTTQADDAARLNRPAAASSSPLPTTTILPPISCNVTSAAGATVRTYDCTAAEEECASRGGLSRQATNSQGRPLNDRINCIVTTR